MLRGFVVTAAVVLAACPRPPPPPTCGPASNLGFGGGGTSAPDEGFKVAGDELSVLMGVNLECPDEIEVRATVAVQDPNNQSTPLLEGEATRVVTDRTSLGMSTTIKVLATMPGPYHFTARFEPNLGLVQRDVIVAQNRRDAGPELVVPSSSMLKSCPQVDLTEDGRPLCLEGAVRLYERDGTTLQTLSTSGSAARVGRALWLRDQATITRWVETDAGFERESDAGLMLSNIVLMAADSEGLLAVGEFEVRMVTFDGGTFADRVDPNIVANGPVSVWKRGDEYLVLGKQNENTTLCSGRFRDAGSCVTAPMFSGTQVFPVASEAAGMWTVTDDQRFFPPVRVLGFRSPALREVVLPAAWSPDAGKAPWDTGAILFRDNGQRMLVTDRVGTLVLQAFPNEKMQSVTSRWVTMQRSNGDIVIYRR